MIHVSAIGLAIGSASVTGLLPEAGAWRLASVSATLLDFAVTALALSLSAKAGG